MRYTVTIGCLLAMLVSWVGATFLAENDQTPGVGMSYSSIEIPRVLPNLLQTTKLVTPVTHIIRYYLFYLLCSGAAPSCIDFKLLDGRQRQALYDERIADNNALHGAFVNKY